MGVSQGTRGHQPASERVIPPRESSSFAGARTDELVPALARCDFPIVVWTADDGVFRLANEAMAELLGLPLRELIGQSVIDRFKPRQTAEAVVKEYAAGRLDMIASRRLLEREGQPDLPVRVWSRAFNLDGRAGAISLVVPASEIGRLGRDPQRPWRTLVPIAVGVARTNWTITAISSDVHEILGLPAEECIGKSFLSYVHPDDAHRLLGPGGATPEEPLVRPDIRFRCADGSWTPVCTMLAPNPTSAQGGLICFAIIGSLPEERIALVDRLQQLELRLRRIAAEVRATGVIDNVSHLENLPDNAQLRNLTTRQWEILNLLVQGQRVPAIARALYVSPSTVRNHLATIFRKFGVHSQSELLELIRRTSMLPRE
jgi:PAS domain S-box-containing protein